MNNCVKKGVLLVVAVFAFMSGWGQANVLEQQKKEFEQGKRDIDFLASYIANLKESKERQALSRALDCYIVLLPEEQRYAEQSVQDFISYIDYQESQVCLDYIKNWDKLTLSEEQVKQMSPKMEVMILWPVFHWMTSPAEKKPAQPDCEEIVLLLENNNVAAVSPTCKTLLEMWQLYKRNATSRGDCKRDRRQRSDRLFSELSVGGNKRVTGTGNTICLGKPLEGRFIGKV